MLAQAKVGEHYVAFGIEENILQLDITIYDSALFERKASSVTQLLTSLQMLSVVLCAVIPVQELARRHICERRPQRSCRADKDE